MVSTCGEQVLSVAACRQIGHTIGMCEQCHAVKWIASERELLQTELVLRDVDHVAILGE